MDRLEQELSRSLPVDSKYGHFVFRHLRAGDQAKLTSKMRAFYLELGIITPSSTADEMTKLAAGDPGFTTALAAYYLDYAAAAKPEGFGSWFEVEDVDELLRVYGEVQSWLDSFRPPLEPAEAGVGGGR